jgi:outer membrane lipoprotein-sorting protein
LIAVVRLPTHTAPARALRAAAGALLSLGLAALAPRAAAQDAAVRPAELAVPATNVLAAVSARYAAVTNVSCTVRRGISVGGKDGGSAEAVSRIVWARGGFLNAQKIAPDRRRTVIDGTTVRTAPEGSKEPISFPVADQLPSQAANLRAVPGSPEEALSVLDPATAEDVAPPAAPFARQVAFRLADTNAPNAVAVVSFDSAGCVARLESFDDASRATLAWTTEFSSPFEPSPGLRLFRRVETASVVDGRTVRATTSYDRLRVNEALPPSIFDPKAFF